jgi:hypothetical protein
VRLPKHESSDRAGPKREDRLRRVCVLALGERSAGALSCLVSPGQEGQQVALAGNADPPPAGFVLDNQAVRGGAHLHWSSEVITTKAGALARAI